MERLYFAFPGNEYLTQQLTMNNPLSLGKMSMRKFPDGESYVRIESDVCGKNVMLVCTLDKPDEKIMPLYFFSNIARSMKAAKLTLVSPYLPYMRQDKIFQKGEGLTSVYYAKLLSSLVDEIITIDPHLHRFHSLSELYSVDTQVLSAAKPIATWIKGHVQHPFVIGPDSESEQWVKQVAALCNAPYSFLSKKRISDTQVEITVPALNPLNYHTPVLVDDIISSGRTMIETILQLRKQGIQNPVCIGVHGLFAGNSYEELKQAGALEIVTTTTITHASNQISISELLQLTEPQK